MQGSSSICTCWCATGINYCELNWYADNMEMHCSNVNLSCVEHDLQKDLNLVYSWLCVNVLSLSIKKSNVMLVGSLQAKTSSTS